MNNKPLDQLLEAHEEYKRTPATTSMPNTPRSP